MRVRVSWATAGDVAAGVSCELKVMINKRRKLREDANDEVSLWPLNSLSKQQSKENVNHKIGILDTQETRVGGEPQED